MCTKCNHRHSNHGCHTAAANACGRCRPVLLTAQNQTNGTGCEKKEKKRNCSPRRNTNCCRPVLLAAPDSAAGENCGCRHRCRCCGGL